MAEEKKEELLKLVAHRPGITQKNLAETLNIAESTLSERISRLEEKGWIDVTRQQGYPNKIELTREGYIQAVGQENPKPIYPPSGAGREVSLHNFSVKFGIRNWQNLSDDWRERWIEKRSDRSLYDESNASYVFWKNEWKFRITGKHVFVRLERELRGDDPGVLKNRAMSEVFDARDWLQDNSPLNIRAEPVDMEIRVARQHLAVVNDPFCELVDQYSDVSLDDVKIYDEDGNERMWLDNSNGEHHLEAGNAPGSNRGMAEDDVENIRAHYDFLLENHEELESLPERVRVGELATSVLLLRELRRDNRSNTSYDNPVQELFMETWRDPDFNRPFFHKDTGGLYAFKTDGSGCVCILPASAVEKLKS